MRQSEGALRYIVARGGGFKNIGEGLRQGLSRTYTPNFQLLPRTE